MNRLTRRRDTTPAVVNDTFAAYTQQTSFSITLGKTHVNGLGWIASGDALWCDGVSALAIPAVRGLERRGLITHHRVNTTDSTRRDEVIELTRAGKLMVLLLIESGHLPAELATHVTP